MGYKVAVVGATGNVGREMLGVLAERRFPADEVVPLVVPEVNAEALRSIPKGIVANPNCSTIQMVVALKPLHDAARIRRVVVSTYQSVSGAGKEAMDELFNQTRAVYVNDASVPEQFTKPIAFNCIPHIDVFLPGGYTKEEVKMINETKKIFGSSGSATNTARVCENNSSIASLPVPETDW